jgi:hypothetical protein
MYISTHQASTKQWQSILISAQNFADWAAQGTRRLIKKSGGCSYSKHHHFPNAAMTQTGVMAGLGPAIHLVATKDGPRVIPTGDA